MYRALLIILLAFFPCKEIRSQVRVHQQPLIVKQNGKFGICDEHGRIVVEALNDTIYSLDGSHSHLEVHAINPFFILKREGKYAYAYCYNIDTSGTTLPKNEQHWVLSDFMYESIKLQGFGSEHYNYFRANHSFGREPYLVAQYRKNGKWGLIYVRATPAYSYYFLGASYPTPGALGELRMTEAKYDTITGYFRQEKHVPDGSIRNESGAYSVRLRGTYNFLEVIHEPTHRDKNNMSRWVNELYKDDGFDTIPLIIENRIYVRKNRKWGHVVLQDDTNTIDYKVPCACNAIFYLYKNVFYCGGENDTLKIFNPKTGHSMVPLPEQKPLICTYFKSPDNYPEHARNEYIGSSWILKTVDGIFYKPEVIDADQGILALTETYSSKDESYKDSIRSLCDVGSSQAVKKLFILDMRRNMIIARFTDTASAYQIHHNHEFIIKISYNTTKKTYAREFYDAFTGFYKFTVETPDRYFYITRSYSMSDDEHKPKLINGTEHHWYKFESEKIKNQKKRKKLGSYDITTGLYSK